MKSLSRIATRSFTCALGSCLWLLLVAGSTLPCSATDWPEYRQNPSRTGSTDEQLSVDTLGRLWVVDSPLPPMPAWYGPAKWDAWSNLRGLNSMRNYDPVYHPIVVGQRLYFSSSADDSVHCVDLTTGETQWQFTTDAPVRIAPTWVDGKLYFGSDDGYAYCISADDGSLVWKYSPSAAHRQVLNHGRMISFWPCRTGVTVVEDIAYFGCSLLPWKNSFLCAVDAATGQPEGEGCYVQELNGSLTLEGSLLVSPNMVICPQGRVPPLAFNRADGTELGSLGGGGGSFVVMVDESIVIHGPGNKRGWLNSTNLQSREQIARYPEGNAIVVSGDHSYMITDDHVVASNFRTQEVLWQTETKYPHELVLAGNLLFLGGEGRVGAIDIETGEEVWSATIEGRAFGLAVANGHFIASTDTGKIYCYGAGGEADDPTLSGNRHEDPAGVSSLFDGEVPAVDEAGMVSRWAFDVRAVDPSQRNGLTLLEDAIIADQVGNRPARLIGEAPVRQAGSAQGALFDGLSGSALITDQIADANLPTEAVTVESWVRIDQEQSWGGIFSAVQHGENYKRGLMLGYQGRAFTFLLSAGENDDLTLLQPREKFTLGQWYHLVGTYDGTTMCLYANGELIRQSTRQRGAVTYPPTGFVELGAFHDDDEYHRTAGMIQEVRLYDRALTAEEVQAHFTTQQQNFPQQAELAAGPWIQFDTPTTAVVRWETATPSPSVVEYGLGATRDRLVRDETPKIHHEVQLTNITNRQLYSYSIQTEEEGTVAVTDAYECDSFFNYNRPDFAQPSGIFADASQAEYAASAETILTHSEVQQGICVVLGSTTGRLGYEIARQSGMQVICFTTDAEEAAQSRAALLEAGVYGRHVAVRKVDSYDQLNIPYHFANLVVSESALQGEAIPLNDEMVAKYLHPVFGLGVFPAESGQWNLVRGESLTGAGDWTHMYGGANNAGFAGEALGGVSSTNDLEVQWISRPGPRYHADRQGRKNSPLYSGGRLFLQGLQRIVAVDSYNGSVLWSLETPTFLRFNIPRDTSNWCTDGEYIYAAVEGRCWQIDAVTGQIVTTHYVTSGPREEWEYDWGYVARTDNLLIGSAVKTDTIVTTFWGRGGWFDGHSGAPVAKVCSDALFATNVETGERLWTHSGGVMLNTTLTAADGRIYFLECRNEGIVSGSERRIGSEALWSDLHMVCLDQQTGEVVWEQSASDIEPGRVMVSLAHSDGKLVLVTNNVVSEQGCRYETRCYDAATGTSAWDSPVETGWTRTDHGKPLSRPVIVGGALYVRPAVIDLESGEVSDVTMPHGGCGTYVCSENAFFFRGGSGQTMKVWDPTGRSSSAWNRLRPACWLSTIPAGGMVLSPEGGGGCSCGRWMETSLGFIPADFDVPRAE